MLELWMGRAKTGKSAAVLEAIAAAQDGTRQLLLVPEYASHQAEVDLCRVCGNTVGRHAEVLSFRLLSRRVLTAAGEPLQSLDKGGKLLILETVLRELAPQLTRFRHPSHRITFLESMVSLFDELESYRVLPEQLLSGGGDKLQDLGLLYGGYRQRLCQDGKDLRDRMSRTLEHLETYTAWDGGTVYVDGFTYFNRQEEQILAWLLHRSEKVVVILQNAKGRESAFAEARRCRERLQRLAQREGQSVRLRWFERAEADTPLSVWEERFFTGRAWDGETGTALQLLEANSPLTEVEQTAARIRELVRSGAYRWRDIGVTLCDPESYTPLVERVFERYEVPVFRSSRSDIVGKPVLRMVLSALAAVTGGYEYEDVFRALKTGLMGLSPEECDLLENYVLRWHIRGSMWVREADWTAHPDGYGMEFTDSAAEKLAQINALRRRVRELLSILAEGFRREEGATGKMQVLYQFLLSAEVPQHLSQKAEEWFAQGEGRLAEEYAQLWQILCDVMDQFVSVLGDAPMDGEDFTRLLRLVLTQYSVGTIPVALDQVNLCPIGANDRKPIRCLFVLGANDSVLPAVSRSTGLLSQEEREQLMEQGVRLAPTGEALLTVQLQQIYAALTRPAEQLTLSYVGGAEGMRPAFAVERLQAIFPALPLRREGEEKDFRLSALRPALELAGGAIGGTLWQYFARQEQYSETLQAMERASRLGRGRLSPSAVDALYGKRLTMSASRMDRANSCHFAYFMQYGLRAKPRSTAGFEAMEIGSFLHFILEHVTRDAIPCGGLGTLAEDKRTDLMDRAIEKYLRTQAGNFDSTTARFRYLFARLRQTASIVLENVSRELAVSDFQPIALELSFGAEGALPAITVRQGEHELSVVGKVDRVDGWLQGDTLYLRVVDYKTGRKKFRLSDVRYGLGIQMLLYLFALEKQGAGYFGVPSVSPAGVLYLPAQSLLVQSHSRMEAEAVRRELEKQLVRSGMLLREPEVLQAMEHSVLDAPQFLPVRLSRGELVESPGGVLATAGQLGELGHYMEKLLGELLAELTAGNVDADPCTQGRADESVCQYCDYRQACHFQTGQDKLRYLAKTAAEDFWKEIEKS